MRNFLATRPPQRKASHWQGANRIVTTVLVCPPLTDTQLNELFAAAWPGHAPGAYQHVLTRSLAYCATFDENVLVGYVNVAWDGGVHAFLLDPTVHPDWRRQGLGLALVHAAIGAATERGAEWLHVDYEPHLAPFYTAAGFRPTDAGLIRVAKGGSSSQPSMPCQTASHCEPYRGRPTSRSSSAWTPRFLRTSCTRSGRRSTVLNSLSGPSRQRCGSSIT